MMSFRLGCILVVLLTSATASAAKTNFKATLDNDGTVPPPPKVGTGTAAFTYDDVTKKLCGKATFTGLTAPPTGVSLQASTTMQLKAVTPVTGSPQNINVTLTSAEFQTIQGGGVFITFLTPTYPLPANGELHGLLEEDAAGREQMCETATPDAGVPDSGTPSSSGTSGTTSGGTSGTGPGTSGGVTEPPAEETVTTTKKDGGCSTSGSPTGGGLLLLGLAVAAIAGVSRGRGRRRI